MAPATQVRVSRRLKNAEIARCDFVQSRCQEGSMAFEVLLALRFRACHSLLLRDYPVGRYNLRPACERFTNHGIVASNLSGRMTDGFGKTLVGSTKGEEVAASLHVDGAITGSLARDSQQ